MATFPSSPAVSQSSSSAAKPRIKSISFGDGYSQRSGDGINSLAYNYSLNWTKITESQRVTLVAFLEARGGYESFDWTPPSAGAALKFTCKEWTWTYGEYNLVDLRATFEQVFDH